MNTHKKIIIKNPDQWDIKYNQKRRQWYYKLTPDFFNDPCIFALSCEAKVLFLDIIRVSQRVDKPSLSYCLDSAKGILRGNLDLVKAALRELKDNDIIDLPSNVRCQLIEENSIEENRIEENKKPTRLVESKSFDLEAAYQNYPRKEAKARGLKKLAKQIKTESMYKDFCMAVENYRKKCEQEGTEKQFIKNFATFAEDWEDFVSLAHGDDGKRIEDIMAKMGVGADAN